MTLAQQHVRDAEAAVRTAAIDVQVQAQRLRAFGLRELVNELEAQAINLQETADFLRDHLGLFEAP
jgi:hypothetical protein